MDLSKFKNKKFLSISLVVLVLLGAVVFIFVRNSPSGSDPCAPALEDGVISGISMAGILENGQSFSADMSYYKCHTPQKGDIVLYNLTNYDGTKILAKMVKAVPGDIVSFAKATSTTQTWWHLYINGVLQKNSRGEEYLLDERAYSGVLKPYSGPIRGYLILANVRVGAEDSTQYGLVFPNDFLGKIIKY